MYNGILSDQLLEKKTALYWISCTDVPICEPTNTMFHTVELSFMKDFRDLAWAAVKVRKKSMSAQLI